jgi:preprotein translocase subunit SecA
MQHQDTTGMGFAGQTEPQQKANQPQQVRTPITVGKKIGRNEKVMVKSPNGKQIEIKYKKLQHYLNQGFTQV